MNITEVIKSGKPFKRPKWTTWVEPHYACIMHKVFGSNKHVTKEDLLAEDWELKPEPKCRCRCCCHCKYSDCDCYSSEGAKGCFSYKERI